MTTDTLNSQEQIVRMGRWVERLRKTRVFRKLHIDADMFPNGEGAISVTLSDGLTTLKTEPFKFQVATMEWDVLYSKIEEDLIEVFRTHLRKILAPERMLPGTSGVGIDEAVTDGEERYVF